MLVEGADHHVLPSQARDVVLPGIDARLPREPDDGWHAVAARCMLAGRRCHLADLDRLADIPRRGWIAAPTPVTPLPDLAASLGLDWLGVKRDDAIEALHGGSKVRKLDTLLAVPPWSEAERWLSFGAIGSGHLAALTAAAERLGRHLDACCVWEHPSGPVLENLAFTASGPTTLRYHSSALGLALWRPRLVLGRHPTAIPAGGSNAVGTLGMVLAGLELAAQIDAGELPEPTRVVCALGTGGTAVGLAWGLALADKAIPVTPVAVLPRPVTPDRRFEALSAEVGALLAKHGVDAKPPALAITRGWVGRGYGWPSRPGRAAIARLAPHGLALEPVYTAKAMAALLATATKGERLLFWHTAHAPGLPSATRWRDRLPPRLRRHLRGATPARQWTRRAVLVGAAGLGAAAVVGRVGFYDGLDDWDGEVLARWEALVLAAAVAPVLGDPLPPGPAPDDVARTVDRYLRGMPAPMLTEIHGLFALIEHGTLLGGGPWRFTRLDPDARRAFLDALGALGGQARAAARGLRDLVLLGWYADPAAWEPLHYDGPWVTADTPPGNDYAELVAPAGSLP